MKYLFLIASMVLSHLSFAQSANVTIDSLIENMSIDDKIGQLFMIRAFSHNDAKNISLLKSQIKKYKPGGLCFFQGSPPKQAELTNVYQKLSDIPLLISIDGEWGLGMRFKDDAISFPKQLTLGAMDNHNLIYDMGREVAVQMRRIGIHVNFAPVVDVNNNANNPVINIRSFGEEKDNVASKAYAYMKGMQDGGLATCIKHFPGHGDTDVDSHYDLPVINHDRRRLDSIEISPFKALINKKADGVMVAHLQVNALDNRENRPTSLSRYVIEDLLQKELGYKGIVYTDAMDMKGVTKHFKGGSADYEAFMAGADFILVTADLEEGFEYLKNKYDEGKLSIERIDRSLRKILKEKERLGVLKGVKPIKLKGIKEDVNNVRSQVIKYKIYENALTLVKNEDILPISKLEGQLFGAVSLGAKKKTEFQKRLNSYVSATTYAIPKDSKSEKYNAVSANLKDRDYVIISIHNMSRYGKKKYGITDLQKKFISNLAKKTKVILTLFGSPYATKYFENMDCVIVAYEEDKLMQDIAAQAIFGALDITGKLPVTASDVFKIGHSIVLPGIQRLGYALPERVGLNSDTLDQIPALMRKMIAERAAPGAQVFVAKDNKIIYEESFGYHTYQKKKKVQSSTIYDVASITKILASTISVMHLYDKGQFHFDDTVKEYFSDEDTTNKRDLIYMDMMSHVSGLIGWIPFYEKTLSDQKRPKPSERYYQKSSSDSFNIEVNRNLFLRSDYQDSIWREVFSSRSRSKQYFKDNKYLYSDLAFYILNWTVERKTMKEVDEYAYEHFYKPLGLKRTGFNPLFNFSKSEISPSERDNYFRMAVIQGFVHDMGAAMLGGVSGHAGLFSTSKEIGVLMQMLLNKGYYGGQRYLKNETIDFCTTRHPKSSRRAIGFDMKELNTSKSLNMSELASENAFGHLGFTGCATFADPDHDLVYVLLANRTFPTMKNNKFGKNNYRPKVQSIIYRSLMN
ncbi:MAG: glycoside hydrolase family 3 N-terminal domain-containing protein [Saprospiraceae bacterium]